MAKSWQTRTFFCLSRRKERKLGERDPFCEPRAEDGTGLLSKRSRTS